MTYNDDDNQASFVVELRNDAVEFLEGEALVG